MDNSERKININEELNLKRYIEDSKSKNEINKEKKRRRKKRIKYQIYRIK